MKKYKVYIGTHSGSIQEVEIEKETNLCYQTIKYGREFKITANHIYFNTYDEAKQHLTEILVNGISFYETKLAETRHHLKQLKDGVQRKES